jgi:F-type H+-transporting ATPase subunit b
MDNLLTLEPGLIIWTFLTFGLLLLILKAFAWKPLISSLDKREKRIHSDVERAEHAREESEQLLADHRKMLARTEVEARRIVDEARKAAEKVRGDILASAEEQARQMTSQAKSEIQREKLTALAQLRDEVADLAIQAAEKILRENMDTERNRRVVDEVIGRMPTN